MGGLPGYAFSSREVSVVIRAGSSSHRPVGGPPPLRGPPLQWSQSCGSLSPSAQSISFLQWWRKTQTPGCYSLVGGREMQKWFLLNNSKYNWHWTCTFWATTVFGTCMEDLKLFSLFVRLEYWLKPLDAFNDWGEAGRHDVSEPLPA